MIERKANYPKISQGYSTWLREKTVFRPLQPIGLDTGSVECLTSYLVRLAQEHCLSPSILTDNALWRQSGVRSTRPANHHWAFVNGLSRTTEEWVKFAEALTGIEGLHRLTLLPWKKCLSAAGIFRTTKGWCPDCVAEDRICYDRLLWQLSSVWRCTRHDRELICQCPVCHSAISTLRTPLLPGFCGQCNNFLGNVRSRKPVMVRCADDHLSRELLCIRRLEHGQSDTASPSLRQLALVLDELIVEIGAGALAELSRRISVPKATLLRWRNGTAMPRLDSLLNVCQALQVAPEAIFSRQKYSWKVACQCKGQKAASRGRSRPPFNKDALRVVFLAECEKLPPCSLNQVCWIAGCSRSAARRHFPDLCEKISTHYRSFQKASREHRERILKSDVEKAVKSLLKEGYIPTRRQIRLRLANPGNAREEIVRIWLDDLYADFLAGSHKLLSPYRSSRFRMVTLSETRIGRRKILENYLSMQPDIKSSSRHGIG